MRSGNTLSLKHEAPVNAQIHSLELFESLVSVREELAETKAKLESTTADLETAAVSVAEVTGKLHSSQRQSTRLEKQLEETKGKLADTKQILNSTVEKHRGQHETSAATIKEQAAELKDLRALNPKRLQQQNKRLQQDKRDQQKAIATLKGENKTLAKNKRELQRLSERLFEDNKKLDGTLDDTVKKLAENTRPQPLVEVGGDWSIYGDTGSSDRLILVDTRNSAQCVIHRTDGISEIRKVPKTVITAATRLFAEMQRVKSELIDYSKPLEDLA